MTVTAEGEAAKTLAESVERALAGKGLPTQDMYVVWSDVELAADRRPILAMCADLASAQVVFAAAPAAGEYYIRHFQGPMLGEMVQGKFYMQIDGLTELPRPPV